jgi:collagenase-like PrtC family protease
MKYFCMPSDFKSETIDEYHEINNRYSHAQIAETYGQLAPDTVFGSCRSPRGLPEVDWACLENYVKYSSDRGIGFNYVINATCMANEELTKSGYQKIGDFLKRLESAGVGWVTISLPSLMEIVKYTAPQLKIKASTVSQINSPLKAKFYEELGISRIVLDEDIHRKFDVLRDIRAVYTGELEVIVNSFCVNDCPFKMFHYNSFSHSHTNRDECSYFQSRCHLMHIGAENFLKLNWIRPEELHYYYDLGIRYFKIQGRTNVIDGNPAKAASCYMDERYEGDLIALLELFSTGRPLAIADCTIDNASLDGFFDRFAADPGFCRKVCSECGYCRQFAEKSMKKSDIGMLEMMSLMKGFLADRFCDGLKQQAADK